MKDQLADLIEQFCRAIHLNAVDELLNGSAFTINEVVFSLTYPALTDPDLFFIHADFGTVPESRKMEAYYALLRYNFSDFLSSNSTFCLAPITGNVTFAGAFPIRSFSVEDLIATLTTMTCQAEQWLNRQGCGVADTFTELPAPIAKHSRSAERPERRRQAPPRALAQCASDHQKK